jgi:hypothetical protein
VPKVSSDGSKATMTPLQPTHRTTAPLDAATKEPVGATLALGTALSVQIEHEAVYLKLDCATPQSADIG